MSARAISAAHREMEERLAEVRAQAFAGIRCGITLAVTGEPFPEDAAKEQTWWGDGVVAGYDAAKD